MSFWVRASGSRTTGHAELLGEMADEVMRTGIVPVGLPAGVLDFRAFLWPEPADADLAGVRETRFNATFAGGDVIVTSRPGRPGQG